MSAVALDELLRASTWGGSEPVELRETHISWVLLAGDRAYKVKKPVVLPFLDFGTLARRRDACRAEVQLNRRLAPDVYLGTAALVRDGDGLRLAGADAPGAVEHVVVMRRFAESETLSAALREGRAESAVLEAIGAWIAAFHARAERAEGGGADALARELEETFATLAAHGRAQPVLERAAAGLLARRREEIEARRTAGRVRDVHGDLRAEHVLVRPEGFAAVDCIEFSTALREIDVADDLAFLALDVLRLAGAGAARALMHGYRAAGGDSGSAALTALFACTKALARAKVALLRAGQLDAVRRVQAEAEAEVAAHLTLARRCAWRALAPVLIAVAGPPASGKTTLSAAIAAESGHAHLESDRVRKDLAGIAHTERGGAQLYDAAHDAATYAALLGRARAAIAGDGGAIVAATFQSTHAREDLEEAARAAGAQLVVVECAAPEEETARRARAREATGADASDAGVEVALARLRAWRPLRGALRIDTRDPLPDQVDRVLVGSTEPRTVEHPLVGP